MTESLYVPAKLTNIDSVIVDVGTGYYAEKSIDQAKSYYKGKIEFLVSNMTKLQSTLGEKQNQYGMIVDVLKMKMQSIEDQQAAKK